MSRLVDTLINENLVPLKPYESARRLFSGGQDWLNANESPYANDYAVDSSNFNRYPSCQPGKVVNGYAAYAGVESSNLIVTRGALSYSFEHFVRQVKTIFLFVPLPMVCTQ